MNSKAWVVLALVAVLVFAGRPGADDSTTPEADIPTTVIDVSRATPPPTEIAPSSTSTTTATTSTVPTTTTTGPPGRTGVFVAAPGGTEQVGTGRLVTYSVSVEEVLGLDATQVASEVDRALSDPRSWTADGRTAFRRVTDGAAVKIVVASPATVDRRCLPLNTAGIYSCRSGSSVNINSDRWLGATSDWSADLATYRNYVVNHEVGHFLGYGHVNCPGPGRPAPLMMQQSKGLDGCVPNPWPFP